MKKYIFSVLLITTAFYTIDFAQNATDPVVMTIAGKPVLKSEFLSIYNKNSNNKNVSGADNKSVEDYVQLFVNFKLKVKEAEEMGLDTAANFKNELEGYRKQLAAPYLTDSEVNDFLLKEAYERMKTDVRASHILIKCDAAALPKDTLLAYNKAVAAKNRLSKGEDFAKVAKEVSEDPSAKENGGDLGYFTSLMMVYPFESCVYTMQPGTISQPVRTRFGYHIIKLTDKRPNQGTITVAHIMVKAAKKDVKDTARSVDPKVKIDEIYAKVKAGEDFAELARQFSDDKGSAKKGGELPAFGTGRMVLEFEKAAFGLTKDGDISEPVQTQYGWHIIKRLSKKPMGSFDELKAEIKSKVTKDSRSQMGKESKIAKIKKEHVFKENLKLRDEFIKCMDTTVFEGKWNKSMASALNKKDLFSIGSMNYSQQDFAIYIESHQSKRPKTDYASIINNAYREFVNEKCLNYEEGLLAKKYPEFKALMQEYRDGILLFELTDRNVWSKAMKDTIGLKEFYEKNKNKYMWDERCEAVIYKCKDQKVAEQTRKMLKNKTKKKYTDEDILKEINKDSQLNLNVEKGKFLKGDNDIIDKLTWKEGITENMNHNNQVVFVDITKVMAPEPKQLNEAKGTITADYQNYLEKNWIESLRKKYTFTIDQQVLSTIK